MNVVVIMFLNYKFKCVQSGIATDRRELNEVKFRLAASYLLHCSA